MSKKIQVQSLSICWRVEVRNFTRKRVVGVETYHATNLKGNSMKITVNVKKLSEAIIKDNERKNFLSKYDPDKFEWGMDVQTCDKWTTEQQGKIWRDLTIAGKLLNTSANAIYSIIKTAKPTRHLFEKTEWVGTEKRGKEVVTEKGLSQWTQSDCSEGIDIITRYLGLVINSVYQEVVIVNWSSKYNKKLNLPDFEFTGKPFRLMGK